MIAADREVPGPVALGDRARERGSLRAHAERVRGVLDVDPLDHAAVAREHGAADVEARVRRVGPRRGRVRAREQLRVRTRCRSSERLEEEEGRERAERAAARDLGRGVHSVSTRVCATRSAMMNVSEEIEEPVRRVVEDERDGHPPRERDRRVP